MSEQHGISPANVTAIVVAFGQVDRLRSTIESARTSGIKQILVWDNSVNASDRSEVLSLAASDVDVHGSGENVGFGEGNNRLAKRAKTPYVLLLNPDCLITRSAIIKLLETLTLDPTTAVVAPAMTYPNGQRGISAGGNPSLLKELLGLSRLDDLLPRSVRRLMISAFGKLYGNNDGALAASLGHGPPISVNWVSGFCMLLRKEDFLGIGGFDSRIFLYFEDVDLCRRLREEGRNVILDRRATAMHYESTTTSTNSKRALYWAGLSRYWEIADSPRRARVASTISGLLRKQRKT